MLENEVPYKPIALGGEYHFCDVGNSLALEYLRKAHEVLAAHLHRTRV
jgi:hypothetical protein